MFTRRHLIKAAGAGLALTGPGFKLRSARAAGAAIDLPAALPDGVRNNAMLDSLPGKKPLIKLSYRPPNYETPIEYFRTAITPNDAFFVRYHLSNIPEVDVKPGKSWLAARVPTARPNSASTISNGCRRPNWSP
jgi:hypothetical protein